MWSIMDPYNILQPMMGICTKAVKKWDWIVVLGVSWLGQRSATGCLRSQLPVPGHLAPSRTGVGFVGIRMPMKHNPNMGT